ncbi:hypothetical protein L596_011358 [Steinernema carpocapsae]|uniref:Uncharacterized protein n=1 Tax=Steinernema carpocapsae TaxID=34508 RepID=A0A4U5NTM1_STECR|nr:hypothetical protein L596_011358 [Steinernema carpocapsae]
MDRDQDRGDEWRTRVAVVQVMWAGRRIFRKCGLRTTSFVDYKMMRLKKDVAFVFTKVTLNICMFIVIKNANLVLESGAQI